MTRKGGLTRRLKTTPRWDKRLPDQPHAVGFAQTCRRADIAIAMHAERGINAGRRDVLSRIRAFA